MMNNEQHDAPKYTKAFYNAHLDVTVKFTEADESGADFVTVGDEPVSNSTILKLWSGRAVSGWEPAAL